MSALPSSASWSSAPRHVTQNSVVDYARYVVDQAIAARDAFSHELHVDLPGVRVTMRGIGGPLEAAATRNFLPAGKSEPLPPDDSVEFFIAHAGIEGISPPAVWGDEIYASHQIAETLAEAGLFASLYHELTHWHVLDIGRRVGVELMTGPTAFPPWETGAPLRPFLHWYYADRGMRLSHAGTLGVDGTGVLLAGAGGSGKSGTVIGGLLHGLQSVGDDYVLLDLKEDVRAYPVYATLKQDAEGFARLGLAEHTDAGALNWQGKHEFRLNEISRVPVPDELRIRAMLVPRVARTAETKISPISRSQAMMALAVSSIYQMPGERESGFRFFSEATRRLPCFRLDLGRDPEEVSAAITRFIGDVAQ
ncbi:hypothetical protein IZ6_29470 [Terrihabitans soli]|uniref:Serine kinase n=1 Tax=Terrihabitans soli TaxID=708113 RepID=A0A6S6QY59_9HYPH|nr:serine kinase [Terrihabitans soli]BCJ92212.1 hypothetical protein IZ6_29470 [Terrihabitans soli]